MDHGILNVPLSKRINLDREIDRYKAEKAAEAKEKRDAAVIKNRDQKSEGKLALAAILAVDGLVDQKAAKLGITRKALLEILSDWAKWQPAKIIKAKADWVKA